MEIFKFDLPSDSRYLDRVYDISSKMLEDVPINLKAKKRILIAISEAVTNSLVHGNKENPAKTIRLTFHHQDSCLRIEIEDEGKGFRPQVADLEERAEKLQEGGRGIPIMKAYMDEVRFKYLKGKGMKVVLTKNLA